MSLRLAFTTLTLLALPSVSSAQIDIVFKKSEGKVGGEVTKTDRSGITVKKQVGGDETVPAADVSYVQWDGEPNEFKTARISERSGRLDDALAQYTAAAGVATGNVKLDAEFLAARVAAGIAAADAAKLDEAIQRLQGYRTANADFFRYDETLALLGDLHTRKGNYDEADAVFSELENAPSNEVKYAARNAKARVLLAKGDVDAALAAYSEVAGAEAATPVEEARRYEAQLGKADCLLQKESFDEAITTLNDVVQQVASGETRIQAEAYLRQGHCYRAMKRDKEALFAYLHVDVLFPAQPALHAEAMYHLVGLWTAVGRPERSAQKKVELQQKYPNSEWTKKLAG